MISRHRLDDALLMAVRAAGACVDEGVLVRGPVVDDGVVSGVEIVRAGRTCRLRAPLVIAADGASSRVARALGLAGHARRPRRWAVGAYFEGLPTNRVEPLAVRGVSARCTCAGTATLASHRYPVG